MTEREIMTPPRRGPAGDAGQPSGPPPSPAELSPAERARLDGQNRAADVGPAEHAPPTVIGSTQAVGTGAYDDSPPVSGAGLATDTRRFGDKVMRGLTTGAGLFTIALIALVAVFLLTEAIPSILDDKANFFFSRQWLVNGADLRFGIVDLLWTTILVSLLAMMIAVPVAIGIALFMTQYAPRRVAKPVGYIIDLLAAVPSIIYGIWGIIVLAPELKPVQRVLYHLDFIPLFGNKGVPAGTVFNAGVVLSIMILPIITAVSRDVFERTPRANIEAAWALGATRWEMIRLAVLPYGRPGVISGSMLGLGRALGETIAITLILSTRAPGTPFSWSLFDGGETFASKIANAAAEFNDPKQTGAFIAGGLVLFLLTFAVNAAARIIVNRRKEFS